MMLIPEFTLNLKAGLRLLASLAALLVCSAAFAQQQQHRRRRALMTLLPTWGKYGIPMSTPTSGNVPACHPGIVA